MTERGASSGVHSAAALSVLVVDDDPDTLALLQSFFERQGHRARGASNASDAVALALEDEGVPDVVVTDLVLTNGAAGWTLAETLREQPHTRDVAIVALTGLVEPEWGVVRHFDAYLRKPIELDLLATIVEQLGQQRRAARAARDAE